MPPYKRTFAQFLPANGACVLAGTLAIFSLNSHVEPSVCAPCEGRPRFDSMGAQRLHPLDSTRLRLTVLNTAKLLERLTPEVALGRGTRGSGASRYRQAGTARSPMDMRTPLPPLASGELDQIPRWSGYIRYRLGKRANSRLAMRSRALPVSSRSAITVRGPLAPSRLRQTLDRPDDFRLRLDDHRHRHPLHRDPRAARVAH